VSRVATSLLPALVLLFPSRGSATLVLDPLGERALQSGGELEAHIGNHCEGERDSSKCHEGGVLVCQGGQTMSYTKCQATEECDHGTCREDVCDSKPDGRHCSSDRVVTCNASQAVSVEECSFYQECKRDPLRANMASCQEHVCEEKVDGSYCKDGHVVSCTGGKTTDTFECSISQKCKAGATNGVQRAVCEEHDCEGKAVGTYCMHGGLVECQRQGSGQFSKCPFYQECHGHGVADCEEDACDDKPDGWHCKGDHRVKCEGLRTVDFEICANFSECRLSLGAAEPVCQSRPPTPAPPADLPPQSAAPDVAMFCSGKSSGAYCLHNMVVECRGMQAVSSTKCSFYQECHGDHGAAHCEENACDDKPDGWRCKGDNRVKCQALRTVDFEICSDADGECRETPGSAICESGAKSVAPSAGALLLAVLLAPAW